MNLPPLQIDTFPGAPDGYDVFFTTFEEVVGRVTTDPAAKIIRLKSHVSGMEFIQFVQDEAEIVNDPIYGEEALLLTP